MYTLISPAPDLSRFIAFSPAAPNASFAALDIASATAPLTASSAGLPMVLDSMVAVLDFARAECGRARDKDNTPARTLSQNGYGRLLRNGMTVGP
mmetsp:Transcript_11230/g.8798  ORF Transcript_11230/g.8798 Transcript_11230/m.8798 type:complete len:95 (+) Transcript_11230:571-855(+)